MSQISLREVCKTFKVLERPEGRFGILKGAFVRQTRRIQALQDVSFTINEGELVGYIGPNGAGKSTTVKIMSGILTPDSGECIILDRTPWKERVAHVSHIGVVFGQRSQLWWDVPVSDSFDLLKDIYSISSIDFSRRLTELTEALQIGGLLKTPVRQLSLGQRMRCEVAASLLHSPSILFLDEPTIGLDAVSKISLRQFLKHENRTKGVTMILTTHDMDDIEALCDRVMVIGRGQLLYNGALDMLRKAYAPLRCIRATLGQPVARFSIEGAEKVLVEKNVWNVWFDPSTTPAHTIIERLAKRAALKDIVIAEENIDQMVAAMYGEMRL